MKNRLKYLAAGIGLTISMTGFGQLQNGSTAPNFTLTDINGTSHTLYDYLNAGKTVYIDFFACHCPYCWNYHNTHALADLYDTHGPNTTSNDVFVFAIELDENNGTNEFYGISGVTQGNWVEGTHYPQINPEGTDRAAIISAYAVNYYPLIYAICPDKTITEIGKKTAEELYNHVTACESSLGIDEQTQGFSVSQSPAEITIHSAMDLTDSNALIVITDLQGKKIETMDFKGNSGSVAIKNMKQGLYFVQIVVHERILFSQKIQL